MSAICGAVGLDGRPWGAADLDGMVRTLAPLGRDGGGRWSGTAGRCGVAVAAALRHSTPQDAADRQPAQSRDGSLVLAGDLRLDNRDELAGLLGLRDHRPVADSAFVLRAGRLPAAVREAAAWGAVSGKSAAGTLARRGVYALLPAPVRRARRAVVRGDDALADWIAATASSSARGQAVSRRARRHQLRWRPAG